VLLAPLLSGEAASANHEAIWALVASLPADQLQQPATTKPGGWISLALAVKRAGTLEQQQAAIDTWRAKTRPPGRQATAMP
jgi:outer membrane PBP1 activator LpoA protein